MPVATSADRASALDPGCPILFAQHLRARQAGYEAVMEALGLDAVLIHSGRPTWRAFDDQAPPFRAHGHFVAWVPEPSTPDCLLVIRRGQTPQLWFCQPQDFWHQAPAAPAAWWADGFDLRTVSEASEWAACFALPRAAAIGEPSHLGQWASAVDLNPPALLQRLDELRTRKSPWEQAALAAANRIAARAHQAAAIAFHGGGSELDIHLAYLAAAGQADEQLPYHSIVAVNEHAAVLHYQYRDSHAPSPRRSFLLDAGASHAGYGSDITRTWLADGAGECHDLFEALLGGMSTLQQGLCDGARAGSSFVALHRQTHQGIAALLRQTGLVDASVEEQIEAGVTRAFFPHGLGHFLGVQVHDVAGKISALGQALPPPSEHPFLRLTRDLAVDEVVTIEPGLYFVPMLLAPLREDQTSNPIARRMNWTAIDGLMPWGGIRIEDNVVVTEAAPLNLTRQAFALLESAPSA